MQSSTNRVPDIFGRDFSVMTLRQQRYWLEQARSHWRRKGFPYPQLSDCETKREFILLGSVKPESILQRNLIKHSTIGLRLANAFHPQMWNVRVHGRSPVDIFADDERLTRALRKAAAFWPNRRCWNGQCLRSVLRIMHRLRVSNFRPTVARALLQRYSGSGETVLDFSAGYGGRLLGALTLTRDYTGIDPNAAQCCGLRSMAKAISAHSSAKVRVIQGCAEEILPTWPSRSFSMVISSPPYFNREKYSDEPTQSYIRYPSYDEWKQQFLKVVLGESFRLLEKRGYLLLNVANSGNFDIASDAEQICSRYFGRPSRVLHMLMTSTPANRAQLSRSKYRWEPVYVFRKA
jgi:hypothetical protein